MNDYTEEQIDHINELIVLEKQMELLWEYHPDNPNHKNLILEYTELKKLSELVKEKINKKN